MILRPYTSDDFDDVIGIFRSNIPKYFGALEEASLRDFLAASDGEKGIAGQVGRDIDYFVAEFNGKVIGSGGIALNDDQTVSLCWGMIHSDYLGKGLGRKLTEFRIEKTLEQYGPLPLVISTSQHTQGFYELFGFRLTHHEPDGFGPGIDICKMRLEMSSTGT